MTMSENKIGKQLVALKKHIVPNFDESNWRELGILTNHLDAIESHGRLLRSYRFGDDDYEGCVLSMLHTIVTADEKHLQTIQHYVQDKCPELGECISSAETGGRRIVFTPSVFRVPESSIDYSLVSAMMPFSGNFSLVYDSIRGASGNAGFKCKRADDIWNDSTVIQDIFSLIFESYIVVCDFSGKNPNVFYEAGIAHTLGKHVIPITQSPDDIPFDLRHHRHIHYQIMRKVVCIWQINLRVALLLFHSKKM